MFRAARTRLVWFKQRWRCLNGACATVTFVEVDVRIAAGRAAVTDRASRWATFQVGHHRAVLLATNAQKQLAIDSR